MSTALSWSVSRFLATFSLELFGLAIIARLVSPAEMGLFVAAFALIRFGQFAAGMGIHMVVIRGQAVDAALVGHIVATLLVTTTTVGIGFAILLVAENALPGVADLKPLLAIMLPGLVLNSAGIPANALLMRDFRFRPVFFLHVSSSLAFQCTAIPLAALGFGASSLAYATLASTTVFVCLASVATHGRFLSRPRLVGIGETTRFSVTIFLTSLSDELQRVSVTLLLGRLGGPAQLGIYSRADDLISKLRMALQDSAMSIVTPLMLGAERERQDLGKIYLDSLSLLLVISLPMGIGLACVAEPLVAILLGSDWSGVAPVLAVLSCLIAVFPIGAIASTTAFAKGRQGAIMRLAFARAISLIAIVALLADGDIRHVALGIVSVALVSHIISTTIVWHLVNLSWAALFRALQKSLLVSALAAVPALAFVYLAGDLNPVWRLFGPVVSSVAVWVGAIFALDHPLRRHTLEFIALRRGRPVPPAPQSRTPGA